VFQGNKRAFFLFILSSLLLVFPCSASDDLTLPELKGRVNDYTSSLSPEQISVLEGKLSALEKEKGAQVAVAIVPTTGPITIEDYAVKLEEKWKIGRDKTNDGVLLVIAKNDRKLRIEVGYGLEGDIPDVIAKRIIEEIIVPEFKEGDFFQGIDMGIDSIIALINGENLPPPKHRPKGNIDFDFLETIAIFVTLLILPFHTILKKNIGNLPSASLFSLGVGLASYAFLPFISVLLFVGVIFLVLLFASSGGGYYSSSSWGGSSGGGFSGGGGGFSGGGGRSGGGGASGSW